jgi:hypothetical protein
VRYNQIIADGHTIELQRHTWINYLITLRNPENKTWHSQSILTDTDEAIG